MLDVEKVRVPFYCLFMLHKLKFYWIGVRVEFHEIGVWLKLYLLNPFICYLQLLGFELFLSAICKKAELFISIQLFNHFLTISLKAFFLLRLANHLLHLLDVVSTHSRDGVVRTCKLVKFDLNGPPPSALQLFVHFPHQLPVLVLRK